MSSVHLSNPQSPVPECSVQESCGGCPLLSLDRDDEIEAKAASVSTHLKAVGVEAEVVFDTVPPRFGYRNRLRMQVIGGRADFFNDAKRNGCAVVRPDLWKAIEHLRAVSEENPELLGTATHLEVRVGDDGAVGLSLPVPVGVDRLTEALGRDWVVADSGTGQPRTLSYDVGGGVRVDVPIDSFVQVNSDVNRLLVAKVIEVATDCGAETFIDLFCGAGNFALPLAAQSLTGTAVESAGSAIRQLRETAAARQHSIVCIEADARTVLDQLERADLVVADPPRAGLGESHGDLVALVDNKLILIACKASAFARDVAALRAEGLNLESVTAFDMFPGTRHVETMAVLSAR